MSSGLVRACNTGSGGPPWRKTPVSLLMPVLSATSISHVTRLLLVSYNLCLCPIILGLTSTNTGLPISIHGSGLVQQDGPLCSPAQTPYILPTWFWSTSLDFIVSPLMWSPIGSSVHFWILEGVLYTHRGQSQPIIRNTPRTPWPALPLDNPCSSALQETLSPLKPEGSDYEVDEEELSADEDC